MDTPRMDELWETDAVEAASARIGELARSRDLGEPVDHLNRWKVRDVVAHLGGVQRWATRIVNERSMKGPGFTKSKLDGDDLCDWFDEGAASLVELLRATDPNDECPNFNPGSAGTVGWWMRRQAHESAVHRWDVEQAYDCTTPLGAEMAADGVDEFLDVFVRTRGKQTLDRTLVLKTNRPRRSWTLTPATKAGRIDVATGPHSSTDGDPTEVSGAPEGLLLALWGRLSVGDAGLKIEGDPETAASLLTV